MTRRIALLMIAFLTPMFAFADDSGWGHLSGRFVYVGEIPAENGIPDAMESGELAKDESLIVNRKNRGVANIVVYLLAKPDSIPVHPSYMKEANSTVRLEMHQERFVPHILLLRTTQSMAQRNKDGVAHHANIQFQRNAPR